MNRPQPEDFPEFFKKYIDTVDDDVISELEAQAQSFPEFLTGLVPEKGDYAYAPGKWSLKELVGHMIDTERIMTYRTLRFARNDSTPAAGFEENDYVAYAHFKDRTIDGLAEEFHLLRKANLHFIRSLTHTELSRTGTASGKTVSVKALLFILAGHVNHHKRIIKEQYL